MRCEQHLLNNMTLFIKQFITFFIEPLGFVMTLLFVGLYFLYINRQAKAKLFLGFSFVSLLLFSYPPFANLLVSGLEDRYAQYEPSGDIAYIHVLGNGHNTDPLQPISSHLSDAGTKRVLEGVVLHKKMPNSKLIFTGYKGRTDTSNAQMNAELAMTLGVDKEAIIINGAPNDTRQEALFSKTIVGQKPFILVTSATHMPRAMQLFKMQGMHPIAAPTDFEREDFRGYFRAPTTDALQKSKIAMHEYIGLFWAKIRG